MSTGVVQRLQRVPARVLLFGALLVVYILLTLAVLHPTPLLDLDGYLRGLHLKHNNPGLATPIDLYVLFGQRGPSTLAFLPLFVWFAWRERSPRPLVALGTALILLNLSVGVVKIITGRIGPFDSENVHEVFAGGNIYPSGHVSNTVVLYGLIAWLAPKYNKTLAAVAVWLSVTVGLGTVYLRTHWISDVFAGWVAGALILVAMPWVMPYSTRFVDAVIGRIRARRAARPDRARVVAPQRTRPVVRAADPPQRVQSARSTPVSSAARSQGRRASVVSFDAPQEPSRFAEPARSPIPSGP